MEAADGGRRGRAGRWARAAGGTGARRRVRRHVAALAPAAALAALAGGCVSRGVDREIPETIKHPTFLSVTNDAQGPLLIGSEQGVYVSLDAGRSWRLARPRAFGARAIGYTRERALISQGAEVYPMDLQLRRRRGIRGPWAFTGVVTALASSPTRRRLWAVTAGRRARLMYTRDDGRTWTRRPTIGLCRHPRAIAAAAQHGPNMRERLYAACGEDGLLLSEDLGITWRRLPGIARASDVATSAAAAEFVVATTPLVAVSRDGGQTWDERPLSAIRVAVSPRNDALIFAIAENGRLYASVDRGRHF